MPQTSVGSQQTAEAVAGCLSLTGKLDKITVFPESLEKAVCYTGLAKEVTVASVHMF